MTEQLSAVARFLFEAGTLKHARRTGWWMAGVRDPESVAEHSWRASLLVGFMGAAASAAWFVAMAIEPIAHVRTLALVELLFAYIISRRVFRERLARIEAIGIVLLVIGLVVVTLGR